MKRPAWRRHVPPDHRASVDPAPALLERIAVAIAGQCGKALRGRGTMLFDPPERVDLPPPTPHGSQAWHSDRGDALDLWCILDAEGARSLLQIVLGGPGGSSPTPLERSIVRETMERLLAASGVPWEERSAAFVRTGASWRCRLVASDAAGISARFTMHAPAAQESPASAAPVDIGGIPIAVSAMLPPICVNVRSIARWRVGEVVPLGCTADVEVRLAVGRACIAKGVLGGNRAQRAVRITSGGRAST